MPARVLIFIVDGYRTLVRPALGARCRFHPSCSDFAREALSSRGAFRGALLTLARLAKCHPFHPGGFDPVAHHG